MNRALPLPLEPANNANFVEFAEALEASQVLPNLVVLHADCTFGDLPVLTETVFLGGLELDHLRGGGWEGRSCGPLVGRGFPLARGGGEGLDAVANVRLARFERMVVTDGKELMPTNGANISLRHSRAAKWLAWGCYSRGSHPG